MYEIQQDHIMSAASAVDLGALDAGVSVKAAA